MTANIPIELTQYKHTCTQLFYKYLLNDNLGELFLGLQLVERHAKDNIGGENANLWFRFFKGYTLVTTIEDILKDLSLPKTHRNYQFMIDSFRLAVCFEGDLEVYYS